MILFYVVLLFSELAVCFVLKAVIQKKGKDKFLLVELNKSEVVELNNR